MGIFCYAPFQNALIYKETIPSFAQRRLQVPSWFKEKCLFCLAGRITWVTLNKQAFKLFLFFAEGNLQNAPRQIFFIGIFCYASFQNALIYKETIPSFAQRRLQVFCASKKDLFCLARRITRVALNEQTFKLFLFFCCG